jgi:vancomycin resistance protein YoaR
VQHDPAALPLGSIPVGRIRSSVADLISPKPLKGEWRSRLTRGLSRAAVVFAVIFAVIALGLGVVRGMYNDRVYPQVYVAGMNIGGMSRDDAMGVLQARAGEIEQGTIAFTFNGQTWNPTLSQIGVAVDYDATLDAALNVGREDDAWERVSSTAGLLRDEHQIPLSMTINRNTLAAWFQSVNDDLGITPHDAYIQIQNGEASIVPEVNGTVVDQAAAEAIVMQAISTLQPVATNLPTETMVANVHESDLEAAFSQINTALSKPVKVEYGGNSWDVSPADFGQYIVQTNDPTKSGAAAVSVETDIKGLSKFLSSTFASEINSDPVDAKIAWSDDLQGVYATEDSVNGVKLKPSTFAQALSSSFFGNHGNVDVPVNEIAPQIDSNNLQALGITTKIAVGDSNFDGSDPGRLNNLTVGTSLLNGTLIPPQGEFSFNHAIGVIDAEKGYIDAGVIDGQNIGRDIGGGICQVSTTVFRAALEAGLPITEWHPHTYRLAFYEADDWQPGFDASILQPDWDPMGGGDFKFQNPSDSWMLVEAYTQGVNDYVIIYGPDLGYTVNISDAVVGEPFPSDEPSFEIVDDSLPAGTINQTQSDVEGVDVYFTRQVIDADGNVLIDETFDSPYKAHPKAWTVSPDMQGQSPAEQK